MRGHLKKINHDIFSMIFLLQNTCILLLLFFKHLPCFLYPEENVLPSQTEIR